MKAPPPYEDYRPLNRRRRLLMLLLAIVMGITVVLTLLDPPGGVDRAKRMPRADAERCAASQTTDCVGGTVSVISPQPPASAPGR